MKRFTILIGVLSLVGCGSVTLPAAVKMADGTALVGTTTASISGGTFQVATADRRITCSGNYDALDTRPTISVPVTCTNGLYGSAVVTRSPDGRSGVGYAAVSDGTTATLAFGNSAGDVLQPAPTGATPLNVANASATSWPTPSPSGPPYPTARIYTGNCPTPDSLDAAGRRCGARSAASRPGGYDGYGSWASGPSSSYGGRTYVRGHYRNGSWVRPHYRRK